MSGAESAAYQRIGIADGAKNGDGPLCPRGDEVMIALAAKPPPWDRVVRPHFSRSVSWFGKG